jgi:hypothetical protein
MLGTPTSIDVAEMDDGTIGICLDTERGELEPLRTRMYLTPSTLELLTAALNRAAHDPAVWRPLK